MCKLHLSAVDRSVYDRCSADDEARRVATWRDAEPACWSWTVPEKHLPRWEHRDEEARRRRLLEWHNGRCAICGEHKKLVCDHDHDSGRVRGWLCTACNTGEDGGGMWRRYRSRPPAVIVGLDIRYWDERLGAYAEPLLSFDPWITRQPGPCRNCYSAAGSPCDCPPVYRLDPDRLFGAIIAAVLVAVRLTVNDVSYTIRDTIGVQDSDDPESVFMRDFLLRPKTDYLVGRWFGGRRKALDATSTARPRTSTVAWDDLTFEPHRSGHETVSVAHHLRSYVRAQPGIQIRIAEQDLAHS